MAGIVFDDEPQPQYGGIVFDDDPNSVAQTAQETAQVAQPAQPAPRKMTQEERIAQNQRAIETARSQEDPGFLSAVGEALAEGARGAGRALKSAGQGILGTATSAVRLAGTPVRAVTGWDGIHRLADKIDSSYENFGRDALMSEYGENPDGWGYALGRAGEKVAGVAGSLAGLGAAGKAVQAASGAAKMAGLARTAKVAENALPLMFGNDAAVRAYDTARANGKTRTEAAALAGLNGAIHFIGFKLFENQSLKKMLNIGPEVEMMMPKWANAMTDAGGQSFSSLARGVRNGMVKYIAAERGKGALKAGGIMGLQDMLSDPVMQVAEGADVDDIDFSRMLKAGAEGVGEGALMEGLMGGAAILRSQNAAERFIADKLFRGRGYEVMGADGKMHKEDGLLESPQGRMLLMKQNPAATERVLDIVDHGGTPRPAELDAAFLPPDMTAEELKKFASDWRNDLRPYVDEAWAADAPRQTAAPDAASAKPGRDMLSPEEAQSQQRAMNDAAEAKRVYDKAHGEVSIDDYNEWNGLYRRGVIDMSLDEWLATKEQRESTPRLRAPTLEEVADDLARRAPEPDEPIKVSPLPEQTPEDSVPADGEVRTSDAASTQAQSLRDQIQRRVESERQAEVGRKVQKELDNFSNAVKNHMDVFNNEAFGRENAELLQAVEDAIRKNNPQLVKERLSKLKNKVRRFANRNALTPKTGGTDETGSVRDEAPAQPEQGASGQPQEGEVGKAETAEPPRAEAPDAGVVEKPAQPAENGPTTAPKSTEAQTPAEHAKPVEAASRASGTTPAVSAPDKASDAQKAALAKLGEGEGVAVTSAKMGKGGVLRVKYTMPSADGRVVEFDSTIDAEGKTSTSVAGVKSAPAPAAQTGEVTSPETPAPAPAPATQDQTNIPNEKKSSPAPAPKSNRLRRADGTDPLAEREQAAAQSSSAPAPSGAEAPEPVSRTVRDNLVEKRLRPILDFVRNEDGSFNPDALRNHDGNNGLPLKDLKLLNKHPEIIDDLQLPAKDAAALRDAVEVAYIESVVGNKSGGGSQRAATAMRYLRTRPNDLRALAKAQAALKYAHEKALNDGKNENAEMIADVLRPLNERINALDPRKQQSILKMIHDEEQNLTNMERKNRVGLVNAEGEDIDVEDTQIADVRRGGKVASDLNKGLKDVEAARVDDEVVKNDPGEALAEKFLGMLGASTDKNAKLTATANGKNITFTWHGHRNARTGELENLSVTKSGKEVLDALWPKDEMGKKKRLSKDEKQEIEWARNVIKELTSGRERDVRESKSDAADLPDAWTPETQKPLENFADKVLKPTGLVKDFEFVPRPEKVDGANAITRKDGTVVGEYDRETGKARFFPGARPEDITHEFTHGLFQHAESEAAAGRPQLKETIDKLVKAMPKVWRDAVGEKYADRPAAEVLEEIFTNGLARLGETGVKGIDAKTGEIIPGREGSGAMAKAMRTLEGKAWYNRAWNAIKELYRDFMRRHGWYNARLDKLDKMSPEEAARHILSEMAKGRSFGDATAGGEGARNAFAGRNGVSAEEDAAYMDAVRRGDTETAQRMVREAAKERGYEVFGLHGTKGEFTVFDKKRIGTANDEGWLGRGFYFWDKGNRTYAWQYANGGKVMEVMLSMKEPYLIDKAEMERLIDAAERHDVKMLEDFSNEVKANGYDSVIDGDGQMLVFEPNQIKSADPVTYDDAGNVIPLSQRFDPQREDIRYSRRVVLPGNPAKPTTDLIDEKRTRGEKLREGAQDADIAIRNVQDELGGITDKQTASGHTDAKTTFKPDGTVDKLGSTDVYSAKMRANGHLQAGFNEIEAGQRRIDKTLADNGLTQAQFDKFLYAEHAPERNQTMAERKAEDADKATWRKARAEAAKGNTAPLDALRKAVVVDPANKEYSGMSTDEANAYLASPAVAAKRTALESAANELYKMERQNLDRLLESGRISKDFHDLLTTRWKKYVPLRTDVEGKDGAAYNLSAGGFRQNEFMTAKGRKSLADSPYVFAMLQVQQGLRGSEANTINLTAANLVRHAESLGHHIGDIMQGKEAGRGKGWTFNFGDGDIVQVGGDMKLAKNRNDIILFKEDGELKAIRLVKGANGRGEALADAITGRNVRQWHKDLSFLPRWTRWLSAMRTQYSPEFIFSNALADHMESTQALIGRYGIKDGFKLAGKALAWEMRNRKDLRRYIKTGDPGTGYVKEAIDAGVLIKGGVAAQGYSGELKNIESNYEKFVRDAKGFGKMSAKEKASFVWDGLKNFISNTNELIENSTRIGIYSALREMRDAKGNHLVSKADAVKFAREATVDFNRKGTYTPWVNGLYMFSNASVQGALRSVQAMGDKHGGQLVGLLVAAGVTKAVLDHYLGNDDEREKEGGRNARNLTEYDKKHKLGVPIGGSKQFTGIRMRGPYAAIPYLAQTFANVALGETSAADAAKTVVRELTDQATDLVSGNGMFKDNGEFDGALLGQSFAPTLADPLVQLYSGKDYKGDERRRKTFDKTMPLSSNGKRNTSDLYKSIAKGINAIPILSGGNENRKGRFDFAPEDLQLVVEFLAGGVGRDIHNVIATGKNIAQAASGGTPERTLSQTPFLRTLVNEYPENTSRYFDALEDYEADKAEFKKTTDPERRKELRDGKPYLFAGKSLLDGQIDRVKELMHLERGEINVGQKWVEPKIERTEEQKEKWRKQRLALQARILKRLGK